jgi:hypothetical protein
MEVLSSGSQKSKFPFYQSSVPELHFSGDMMNKINRTLFFWFSQDNRATVLTLENQLHSAFLRLIGCFG